MDDRIPLQEIECLSEVSYRRLLDCAETYQDRGVHCLPARVEHKEGHGTVIIGRIAGPFEALSDAIVHFQMTERLASEWTIPVLDREPY